MELWCTSFDGIDFGPDTFSSKRKALESTKRMADTDVKHEKIYVAKCERVLNAELFPDGELIVEHMQCQSDDLRSECSDVYPDVAEEAIEDLTGRLQAVLELWCREHNLKPTFMRVGESECYSFNSLELIV